MTSTAGQHVEENSHLFTTGKKFNILTFSKTIENMTSISGQQLVETNNSLTSGKTFKWSNIILTSAKC